MTVNKVEYAGKVLLDLTEDTVTPDKLISGEIAHDKTGAKIVGTLEDVGDGKYIWKKHIGKVWDVTTTHLGTTAPSDYSGFIYGYYIATDDGYFLGQQGGTDQCRYCKNAGESNLDKWAGT